MSFLDGTLVPWAKDDGLDAVIAEQDVKAIEVYTRSESVPNTIRSAAAAQSIGKENCG